MLDRGSMAFLIPKEGRVDKVYDVLKKANRKGLRVYKKDRIPTKYHIKHSSRTAPILLVAEKGYFVRGFSKQGLTKPVWDVIYSGHHGYDPYDVKEMRTIMYARGPGLKHDYTSKPLMMTDHYNLICHQLDIDARPNNGSWLRVQGMLEDTADSNVVYRQLRSSTHPTISNYYLLILSAFTSILLSFVPVST
ncbi:Ectonucleotide pyrophosphatase/phosphodiesterase family member 5 [Halotydeus destructor]|nr:Ectonucleotide pyrophosphatase/phosphodiesterase family member 5 [Halotydeus destructor]